ncbi:MAG: HAMP domain-containing sensor histidine kinase [Myxococcota bacterium]
MRRWPARSRRGRFSLWRRFRVVYRRLWTALFFAFGLGLLGGAGFALAQGAWGWLAIVGAFALLWPMAGMATFRIARPVVELARVAQDLRTGQLERRTEIRAGDDEVGEVASALRTMADQVAHQLDDQRALMAAVSHELRSPLGRLRVLVELAREDRAPDDLHDSLQAEIDGMDTLVGDLLAASRIDFDAVDRTALPVREVVERALDLAGRSRGDLSLDRDGTTILADPTLLSRALVVLLDNARRHGAEPIRLEVEHDDDGVAIAVLDEGPGIAEGEEESVFQPFVSGGRSSEGTGLGLALVRRIARSHDGRAWAENRPEGGARVTLWLPRG